MREELKKPQGILIEGPFEETMHRLKMFIDKEKPSLVIAVGDIVSNQMIKFGLALDILIVDNRTMRKPTQPVVADVDQTFYAKNSPGTITNEAWATIRSAIELAGRSKIIIDGEEDLLTIVTVLSAPKNAVVIYGQPNVGIVVVKVTAEIKEKMRSIVDSMKKSSKN